MNDFVAFLYGKTLEAYPDRPEQEAESRGASNSLERPVGSWTAEDWEKAHRLAEEAAWQAAWEAVRAGADRTRWEATGRALAWSHAAREAALAAHPQYAR